MVTDTETTGLSPQDNRIIEIAAIRTSGRSEAASFSRLIDPGESISYRITRLTGITTAMVYGQPVAEEVLPEYFDFLGDGVLVAHNLSFDLGFLNAERGRMGLGAIANPGLCTLRLARRLLPGLRSKSLGNLARFFRIPASGRHRALRDAEITTVLLARLVDIAANEHHIVTLEELLDLQRRTYARLTPASRHVLTIRREVLPTLPDSPGVYRMLDGRGRVLYVGKAKVLANRVRSYFNAIEAHPPRIRQLIGKLRDVGWTETGTELEALLLESRLISELDPPFNRAQKRTVIRPYLRVGRNFETTKLTIHQSPGQDEGIYYGPFRTRGEARTILDVIERFFPVRTCDDREFSVGQRCLRADIGRCVAPCVETAARELHAELIDRVTAFLEGETEAVMAAIHEEMNRASGQMAFEEAARMRDAAHLIEALHVRTGRIAARIFDDHAIILHRPLDSNPGDLILLHQGRFVSSIRRFDAADSSHLERLHRAISRLKKDTTACEFSDANSSPETAGTIANSIRVINHWLYANRENILRIDYNDEEQVEAIVKRIVDESDSIKRKLLQS